MNVDFEHLAGSAEFAKFTAIITNLTGLMMSLKSPEGVWRWTFGNRIGNPVCRIIRGTPEGLRRCLDCDRRHYQKAVRKDRALIYACHAGFLDMAVPVFIQRQYVAMIASGQVLPEPPGNAGFTRLRRRLRWLNCPEAVLRRAYFKSPYLPREKVRHILELLKLFAGQLCDTLRKIKELEARLERAEIRRAKEFVEQRFHDPSLGLNEVAAHIGLSPAYFSHLFKQCAGMTFVRFVQERRVAEAKALMTCANQSLKEIGFSCGFKSTTNFNRVFRRIERRSPHQFRKSRGALDQ